MNSIRKCPGGVYSPQTRSVHLFGGWGESPHVRPFQGTGAAYLNTSESFSLSTSVWTQNSNMIFPRAAFNPCLSAPLIWLCGGRSATVETFSITSGLFTLIPEFVLPAHSCNVALIRNSELVVITNCHVCVFGVKSRETVLIRKHMEYYSWSNCTPGVTNNAVFISDNVFKVIRKIDFITGEMTKLQ